MFAIYAEVLQKMKLETFTMRCCDVQFRRLKHRSRQGKCNFNHCIDAMECKPLYQNERGYNADIIIMQVVLLLCMPQNYE